MIWVVSGALMNGLEWGNGDDRDALRYAAGMGKTTVLVLGALAALGCAGGAHKVDSQGQKEPLVPPGQVEASKELMGTQQSFMTDLNRTNSEQAGARHEADQPAQAKPVEKGTEER